MAQIGRHIDEGRKAALTLERELAATELGTPPSSMPTDYKGHNYLAAELGTPPPSTPMDYKGHNYLAAEVGTACHRCPRTI